MKCYVNSFNCGPQKFLFWSWSCRWIEEAQDWHGHKGDSVNVMSQSHSEAIFINCSSPYDVMTANETTHKLMKSHVQIYASRHLYYELLELFPPACEKLAVGLSEVVIEKSVYEDVVSRVHPSNWYEMGMEDCRQLSPKVVQIGQLRRHPRQNKYYENHHHRHDCLECSNISLFLERKVNDVMLLFLKRGSSLMSLPNDYETGLHCVSFFYYYFS